VALGVRGHRLIVRPEAEVEGKEVAEVIRELLDSVPVLESESPARGREKAKGGAWGP